MQRAGRILIVDDSKMVRMKLQKATEALGYQSVSVESGKLALEQVSQSSFDLVLLDIIMPEMDGFDVLRELKASRQSRDLPVIVVSGLGEEMSSVIKAIELGAEDFLPKDFEPALLEARVSTCIEKKQLRDVEKEYIRQVGKLTQAANALESGRFNPSKLGIQEVAERTDGLGKLATVFATMAQTVYERERKMRQHIRTFRGGLLLLACGALWGLIVPLSKMAANIASHPIGLTLLVDLLGAFMCLGYAAKRKTIPRLSSITRSDWIFILAFALLSSVVNQVLVYWMTSKLPAFIVAIVIVLEGFAVFLFAAVMRVEDPSLKRFFGLGLGLVGVSLIVIFSDSDGGGDGDWLWIALSLLIPLTYGLEDLFISQKRPCPYGQYGDVWSGPGMFLRDADSHCGDFGRFHSICIVAGRYGCHRGADVGLRHAGDAAVCKLDRHDGSGLCQSERLCCYRRRHWMEHRAAGGTHPRLDLGGAGADRRWFDNGRAQERSRGRAAAI